ncbi:hypothetical protein OsI_29772 [Oryza sativa Indica Group]|uniref:Uncharacterized protein n=1 Tax=Oryza sativa subsp. indica TaxID=39946 RepID=B8BC57_ORYSI|nr:hypothetical protein OsI_29772 [Oryza sativa Indica Group]
MAAELVGEGDGGRRRRSGVEAAGSNGWRCGGGGCRWIGQAAVGWRRRRRLVVGGEAPDLRPPNVLRLAVVRQERRRRLAIGTRRRKWPTVRGEAAVAGSVPCKSYPAANGRKAVEAAPAGGRETEEEAAVGGGRGRGGRIHAL